MTDFATWAAHYGYDPETPEARADYAEYVTNARLFDAVFFQLDRSKGTPAAVARSNQPAPTKSDEESDSE